MTRAGPRRSDSRLRSLLTPLGVAAALGLGFLVASGRENVPDSPDRAGTPAERGAGCPICLKMIESVPQNEFSRDAHPFECGVCHHPHTQRSSEQWRATCSQEGCHPRAWTLTVFHRVEAEDFVTCTNCHGVHQWSLDGQDCRSCHGAFADSAGTIPVTQVAGVTGFAHAPHRSVECVQCHTSERRHGGLSLSSFSDCSGCHHAGREATSCTSCHGGRELDFSKRVDLRMALSMWDAPQTRQVTFPHAIHARGTTCGSCHAGGGMAGTADCATCHSGHHAGEADCTQCHAVPPADSHDLSVHQAECTDCHTQGPARVPEPSREFCLTCHRTMGDHNPGERCTDCHDPASIEAD